MKHSLVVVSCWQYQDLWQPFIELFKRYWDPLQDLEMELTLLSDPEPGGARPADVNPFRLHQVNDNRWAKRLLAFCEAEKPDTMLLLHEDYFLTSRIRPDKIQEAYQSLEDKEVGCVRLFPCPGPDYTFPGSGWGLVDSEAPYKISCQAAIWKVNYLKKILEHVETSPEFELKGTRIAHGMPEKVLSWRREFLPWPMEYYCTAVVQGKWQRGALELCKREGVEVISSRPVDEGAL